MQFTTVERNAQADAFGARLTTLRLMTASDAVIANIPFAGFAAAVDGTITANPMAEVEANAGVAAKFAALDAQGTTRATGTVTIASGSGDVKINAASTEFVAGQPIRVNSLTLTVKA